MLLTAPGQGGSPTQNLTNRCPSLLNAEEAALMRVQPPPRGWAPQRQALWVLKMRRASQWLLSYYSMLNNCMYGRNWRKLEARASGAPRVGVNFCLRIQVRIS